MSAKWVTDGDLARLVAGVLRERSGFDVEMIKFIYAKGKSLQILLLFLHSLPTFDFCAICNSAKISL